MQHRLCTFALPPVYTGALLGTAVIVWQVTGDGEAAAWEPGVEGLLFAPYLAGERTPHADPNARGAFVGLSLRHPIHAEARGRRDHLARVPHAERSG